MKQLLMTAVVASAFALPFAAIGQERYPALNPGQLTPEQKAYVENLQKPPRNNTTALKNPPFRVYMRSPELAVKLEAVSDYVRWGSGRANGSGAATTERLCAAVSIRASVPILRLVNAQKK